MRLLGHEAEDFEVNELNEPAATYHKGLDCLRMDIFSGLEHLYKGVRGNAFNTRNQRSESGMYFGRGRGHLHGDPRVLFGGVFAKAGTCTGDPRVVCGGIFTGAAAAASLRV